MLTLTLILEITVESTLRLINSSGIVAIVLLAVLSPFLDMF